MRKPNAQTIRQVVKELAEFRSGCPKYLVTDNGTEFANKIVSAMVKQLGIIQTTVEMYHTQANPVERCNTVIKKMVSILVGKDHRN